MIKIKTARKLLIALVALSLALLLNVPSNVDAAALTNESVSLSNTSPTTSASYTFKFDIAQAVAITEVDLVFSNSATGGTVPPSGMVTTAGTMTSGASGLNIASYTDTWAAHFTNSGASNGTIVLLDTTGTPTAPSAGGAATVVIGGITNPSQLSCHGNATTETADTCFVQITTKNGATVEDTGTATFTYQPSITASATVDPSLTFTVAGVASSSGGDDPHNDITTSATSTYTQLPFGHILVGAAANTYMVAQDLTISTNARNGFNVTMAATTPMTGSSSNGSPAIGPFATATSSWSSPAVWASPTGSNAQGSSANITLNAGAFGANTTDTHVTGFGTHTTGGVANALWGPVNTTQNNVMQSTSTCTTGNTCPVNADIQRVAYQIGVDAYQPADTYTGTIQYYATPTY